MEKITKEEYNKAVRDAQIKEMQQEMEAEDTGTTFIVECDCGAFEEFEEGDKPKLFPETPDGAFCCPFCEEWTPEPPEGYTRPVFTPPKDTGAAEVPVVETEWLS